MAQAPSAQVESISQQFVASGPYAARLPNRLVVAGASLYLADLYSAFLKRPVDAAGFQYWVSQVGTGAQTREQVWQAFVVSPEFQSVVSAIVAQGCLQ